LRLWESFKLENGEKGLDITANHSFSNLYRGVASLNDVREFFNLKRYTKMEEINSDPEVADLLRKLYNDPDMVELYPGLLIEDPKPVVTPGHGACLNFTLGRAVLSDAITLVRSDRFSTIVGLQKILQDLRLNTSRTSLQPP
jgi:hypothetical protein